jgi:hypothetical protein
LSIMNVIKIPPPSLRANSGMRMLAPSVPSSSFAEGEAPKVLVIFSAFEKLTPGRPLGFGVEGPSADADGTGTSALAVGSGSAV